MKNDQAASIAIIGAGSWGTALAVLLGRQTKDVRLWPRRREQAEVISLQRENSRYLPGIPLPESIKVCTELKEAIANSELVVLAVPAAGMRAISKQISPYLQPGQSLLSVAKGLEVETAKRMSEVIDEVLPHQPLAVLSGPNLASEVAAGIPTTSVVASCDETLNKFVQGVFMCRVFRVYTNMDIIGVELGGALKNIVAIGAGISDGLGFGDNTKAALVTRGLAEMTRLGLVMGARSLTFQGLSGMGDLIATCASPHSRNYKVGFRLAKGESTSEILASMEQIAEGVPTTQAAVILAQRHGAEMPIASHLQEVLLGKVSPKAAVTALMSRPAKEEWEGYA